MARNYTLRKRAAGQAETRRRIVEAAVALHGSTGPAQTTVSMVAERAGVQRHTLYAHFPDERSLLMACSGLVAERDPRPDARQWRTIADRGARLTAGLTALYAWYARNADLMACVTRDAQHHALTREIAELRTGPAMAACREVLGAGSGSGGRAALALALSFHGWATLVRDEGLRQDEAVAVMVRMVLAADGNAMAPPVSFSLGRDG